MTIDLTKDLADYRAYWHEQLAIAEKATAGPWWNEDGHPAVFAKTPKCRPNGEGLLQVSYYGRYVGKDAYADATFIATIRTTGPEAIRALLRAVDALEESLIYCPKEIYDGRTYDQQPYRKVEIALRDILAEWKKGRE